MKFYFVKPGDTLVKISILYGISEEEIISRNNINNPNLIYPNQPILIPDSAKLSPFPLRKIMPRTEMIRSTENVPQEEVITQLEKYESCPEENFARSPIDDRATYPVTGDDTLNNITNPSLIYPEQKLRASSPEPVLPPTQVPTKTYTVQIGDTLFKIAQQFDLPIGTLISLNNITDPDQIYQGTEILVPRAGNS